MAGSLNRVMLIGNVGKDPEIKTLNSGDKIANLSIATSESWTDKSSGEKKEKTEWHRVVVFGQAAGIVERYVKKGSKIMVEGALQTRKYEKDGVDHYSTEVVLSGFNGKLLLLGDKSEGGSQSRGDHQSGGNSNNQSNTRQSAPADIDDEIPF
jgi:single-strand DNA-binding protein